MRAAVLNDSGELEVRRVPVPSPMGCDLLVKVRAVGLCGSDLRLARERCQPAVGDVRQPLFLGHELIGEVVARGPQAGDALALGSRIAALPCLRRAGVLAWFGESATLPGAYAEACLVDSEMSVEVPEELTDRAATFIEPLAMAVHAVTRAELRPQDRPVVVGAGPLGLAVIMALRAHGVRGILAVERAPGRCGLARVAGAETVVESLAAALPFITESSLARRPGLYSLPDVTNDPRTVFFECAGAADVLTDICTLGPNGARIMGLGLSSERSSLPLHHAVTRQLEMRFVVVYNMVHFHTAVQLARINSALLESMVSVELSLGDLVSQWSQIVSAASLAAGKVVVVP